VALDQNVTPSAPETTRTSAIENEIPAYRAISPFAVVSLICGILAILSFANWYFLAFSVGAIALGIQADRRIKRDPEIWTGKGLAQAGIGLGLIFGLMAITFSTVQDQMNKRAAAKFAREYVDILKTRGIEEAIFYSLAPASREGKKPSELYAEVKKQNEPGGMEMRYGSLQKLKQRLTSGAGQDIHFERIESSGYEGIRPYAAALVEVHGPATKDFPEKEQFALLLMKAMTDKGKSQWWVDETRFPYTPASFVPTAKAPDDGHGHSH